MNTNKIAWHICTWLNYSDGLQYLEMACFFSSSSLAIWHGDSWLSFFPLILLLFNYSCPHLPPTILPHPTHPHLKNSVLSPSPCWLCSWVLHTCSLMTLPLLSPVVPLPPPLWLLSVLYFNVSGYILLAYLFCWLDSTYRWDHIVLIFHCLAYFT